MSDQQYEQFQQYGTNAERLAFTPDPAGSIQPIYVWYETDTGKTFLYDTTWHQIASTSGGGIPTVAQGDLLYGSAANTLSALTKDTNATRYLSNTGSSNNPAWAQVDLTNGVTGDLPFANLAQGAALSVLGVTGNATADVASIAAGTDGHVLRRSGTAVAFGTLASGAFPSTMFVPLLASGSWTDAQIKALPTTGLEMVGGPGSGFRIKPLALTLILDASAGAYTNITTTYSDLAVYCSTSGKWLALPLINDDSLTTPLAHVSSFFGNAQTRVLDVQFPYMDTVNNAGASGSRTYIDYLANSGMASIANTDNNGVSIKSGNTGDFTGGNAANTLDYRFYYVIEALP